MSFRRAALTMLVGSALLVLPGSAPAAVTPPTLSVTTSLGNTGYIGAGSWPITATASAPKGISALGWTSDDGQRNSWMNLSCQPQFCDDVAPKAKALGAYNSTTAPEGHHTVTVTASTPTGDATNPKLSSSQIISFSVDRTPPAVPAMLDGWYDASSQTAYLSWAGSADPALPDGTPGSGTASYSYQYAVNGGTQTLAQTTAYPSFAVGGVHAGDHIAFTVKAVDAVGNTSAPVTATVTIVVPPSNDDCVPHEWGAYPAACLPADADMDDDNLDDVTLDPVVTGLAAGAPTTQYRINVGIPSGDPSVPASTRWATIRNKAQQFVIGNAKHGWTVTADLRSNDVKSYDGTKNDWFRGTITRTDGGLSTPVAGPVNGCGWVIGKNVDRSFDPAPDPLSRCAALRADIVNYITKTNCPRIDQPSGSLACNHGSAVYLEKGTPECANVGLSDSTGNTTAGVCDQVGSLKAGSCVEWRYITKDNKYVMVKDPYVYNYQASWIFIERGALNGRDGALPNISTHRPQRCARIPKVR